jgi:tetratricopeptide (TPR) repeat protein
MKPEIIGPQSFIGNLYYQKGDFNQAAAHLEHAVQKNITDLSSWSILIDCYQALGDTAKRNRNIDESRPLYELFLEKFPSNTNIRAHFALNLANRGLKDDAHKQIAIILRSSDISGTEYYNIACTYSRLKEPKLALEMLNKSFEKGNNPGESIYTDPDFENIRNLPEFKEIAKKMMSNTQKTGIRMN